MLDHIGDANPVKLMRWCFGPTCKSNLLCGRHGEGPGSEPIMLCVTVNESLYFFLTITGTQMVSPIFRILLGNAITFPKKWCALCHGAYKARNWVEYVDTA